MLGKPTSSAIGDTSVPSLRLGYRLPGGLVPLLIQPSSATSKARAGGPAFRGLVGKAQVFAIPDLALANAKCCRFEIRNSLTLSGISSALPFVSVTTSEARC